MLSTPIVVAAVAAAILSIVLCAMYTSQREVYIAHNTLDSIATCLSPEGAPIGQLLEERDERVKAREGEVGEREESVKVKESELEGRVAELDAREEAVKNREAALKAKEDELAFKETSLKELEASLLSQAASLEAKAASLASKDAELKAKETELKAKEAQLKGQETTLTLATRLFSHVVGPVFGERVVSPLNALQWKAPLDPRTRTPKEEPGRLNVSTRGR
ncbi:hypothetical protein NMY22_g20066 [Coprinellus aureogranulatus]|nr:hypothetical protein NMY22_g20066 [Coprinellus aureogranulatus]